MAASSGGSLKKQVFGIRVAATKNKKERDKTGRQDSWAMVVLLDGSRKGAWEEGRKIEERGGENIR